MINNKNVLFLKKTKPYKEIANGFYSFFTSVMPFVFINIKLHQASPKPSQEKNWSTYRSLGQICSP